MSRRLTRDEVVRWDRAARVVGGWPRERYETELRRAAPTDRPELALMRYRWRLDELATDVMSEALAMTGPVSPPNALDDAVYGLPLSRWWDPRPTTLSLVMTGRGVGKTTRSRIKRLHAMLYGLSRVGVVLGRRSSDAQETISTLAEHWLTRAHDDGMLLAQLWPETRWEAKEGRLTVRTRFGRSDLLGRGWDSSLRGMNVGGHRPDSVDLDDIESEDGSVSESARDRTQAKLTGKVLPLGAQRGGLQVLWAQTPVHPDAVAVRAQRGDPELAGWQVTALPVITRWPDDTDGWDALREVYHDADTRPRQADREARVRELYAEQRDALDAGAEVLDPVNLGVLGCHLKLWQVGRTAFAREYEMSTASAGRVFVPAEWQRHEVQDGCIVRTPPGGRPQRTPLTMCRLWAHLDPSDGGDDAALVVVAETGGRLYEVGGRVWQGARLSVVVAELAAVVRPFVDAGLTELQWEPPPGAASVVEAAIRAALDDAGLDRLDLAPRPSTSREHKETRIVNTLEAPLTHGLLSIRRDLPRRLETQAEAFDPARRNNRDDWLDGLQRCVEGLMGYTQTPGAPTAHELNDALDALPAGGVW